MPPGRPPLLPKVKKGNIARSRQQYEEKYTLEAIFFHKVLTMLNRNADERREKARLRMQRKRAAITAGDPIIHAQYRSRASQASERYRDRKREDERTETLAAAALKRRERRIEADALRCKHTQLQARHGQLRPAMKKAKRLLAPPKDLAAPARRVASPTPNPALKKARRLPAPVLHLAPSRRRLASPSSRRLSDIAQDDEEDSSDEAREDDDFNDTTRRGHCLPPPVFEHRVVSDARRCPQCFEEGCPGCACMCEESAAWIEHEGGHFFPTCKKCGEDECPGLYFCLPHYKPDPGHEDKSVHDKSARARYYAIVAETWGGVVTSPEAVTRELARYPGARTFSAATWRDIMDWWNDDCQRNHDHESSTPESSPDSSPQSSVSTALTPAEVPRSVSPLKLTSRRVPSPTKGVMSSSVPRSASPSKPKSHRTPSPTKAIARLPPPAPLIEGALGSPCTMVPVSPFPNGARNRCMQQNNTEYVASKFQSWMEADGGERKPLLFYGVSGHNRVFQDWDRAMAAMKSTPGADLIFAHDEAAVQEFVRVEAAQMLRKLDV
ncbi:hypothetical protein C8R45DRAFT_923650 [Mycena sanguinolenta]|nr:hypothetical protein C8R45DRAFT_923650 [Mycena sanguinolenta]